MKRIFIAVLTVAFAALAAHADIDRSTTEGGAYHLSGGRTELESFGLTDLIESTNNALLMAATLPTANGPIDYFYGLDASDMVIPIGYLVAGPNSSLLTFDRLAFVPVLQVLGYDQTDMLTDFFSPSGAANQATNLPFGHDIGDAGPRPRFLSMPPLPQFIDQDFLTEEPGFIDQDFMVVPEPNVAAMMMVLVVFAVSHRSTRRAS